MRSSSAHGRRAIGVMRVTFVRSALSAAFLSLVICASCAPRPEPAPAPEPSVTLEGEVALAGENPLDRIVVLADAGGSVCALSSPRFEYELRSLAGQRVRVTGRIAGKTAAGPEFLVESYELAPVGGRAPVAGTLALRGDGLVLVESRSGAEYVVAGPLANALRAFSGFKVWIEGPTTPPEEKNGAGGTLTVESYGILAPPAAGMPAAGMLEPPAGAVPAPSAPTTPERP
jgi:hypothetical protein